MQAISTNIKDVDTIRKIINEQFCVKAWLWQVSIVIDIIK